MTTDAAIPSLAESPESLESTKEVITTTMINGDNNTQVLEGGSEDSTSTSSTLELEPERDSESESLESKPDVLETETSLEGGAVSVQHEYKINYIVPDDEKLVNIEKIKASVKRYIDNYHSDAMKKYKQLFKVVYQKYSSKRYMIDNTDTDIIVSKVVDRGSKGDAKRGEIVYEISKPKYIFYNKNNNLITMKTLISNKRQELQLHYQSLVNKLDVQPEEKKTFEKERKLFIDLLERYYIYNLYHNQINNISLEGKTNIIVQELYGFLDSNAERQIILDGNLYTIDNTLVEKMNTNNSTRLNTYNDLIIKLQSIKSTLGVAAASGKTASDKSDKATQAKKSVDKLVEEIKEYLKSNNENAKLNNEIKDSARAQNTYIDYIISSVPSN